MARFIKGQVRLKRLDAWLRADARQWDAMPGLPAFMLAPPGRDVDAAVASLDGAFAATFGGA